MTTFWIYKDRVGQWRWQLVHNSNGKIIADSAEAYWNKSDCLHGVNIVKASSTSLVRER